MSRASRDQVVILAAVVLLLMLGTHFWLTDRKGVLRTVYPIPAFFSAVSTRCSDRSPHWLLNMMELGTWELRALSSQIAYITSDGELFHCESGWQKRSFFSRFVSVDTRFRYGSLTKPITSAALLKLERSGKLQLKEPVVDWLLAGNLELSDPRVAKITADDLLRHRAGLVGEVFTRNQKPWCPDNIDQLSHEKLQVTALEQANYSNLGYCILGELVARVSGKDFRQVVDEQFSLKQRDIDFAALAEAPDEVWHDYRYNDFFRPDLRANFDYEAVASTAGMTGSAAAYAKLVKDILALDLDGFLSVADGIDMKNCDATKVRNCYGRAFFLFRAENGKYLNVKGGHMPGFSGVVVISDSSEVFVWLGNSDTPNAVAGVHISKFINALANWVGSSL